MQFFVSYHSRISSDQSVERLTAEREVAGAGSIPGTGPALSVLKMTE